MVDVNGVCIYVGIGFINVNVILFRVVRLEEVFVGKKFFEEMIVVVV